MANFTVSAITEVLISSSLRQNESGKWKAAAVATSGWSHNENILAASAVLEIGPVSHMIVLLMGKELQVALKTMEASVEKTINIVTDHLIIKSGMHNVVVTNQTDDEVGVTYYKV